MPVLYFITINGKTNKVPCLGKDQGLIRYSLTGANVFSLCGFWLSEDHLKLIKAFKGKNALNKNNLNLNLHCTYSLITFVSSHLQVPDAFHLHQLQTDEAYCLFHITFACKVLFVRQ